MNEIFCAMDVQYADANTIRIDTTYKRWHLFKILLIPVGFFLVFMISTYNKMSGTEISFTALALIIFLAVYRYRKFICHRSVVFNRNSGTITYMRSVAYVDQIFRFSQTKIIAKKMIFKQETLYRIMLLHLPTGKSYHICSCKANLVPENFLTNFMASAPLLINQITPYERQNEPNPFAFI